MLETVAVHRTALRVTTEALAALYGFVQQMDSAVAAGQSQLFAAANMSFHRQIVVLSGNRALANAWEPVAPLIETILGISDATCASAELPGAVDGHRNIIGALAKHDVAEAEALLKVHLQGGQRLVFEAIRSVRTVPFEV